jgi:hypothetical protein
MLCADCKFFEAEKCVYAERKPVRPPELLTLYNAKGGCDLGKSKIRRPGQCEWSGYICDRDATTVVSFDPDAKNLCASHANQRAAGLSGMPLSEQAAYAIRAETE